MLNNILSNAKIPEKKQSEEIKNSENLILENLAISDYNGKLDFAVARNDHSVENSWQRGISSVVSDHHRGERLFDYDENELDDGEIVDDLYSSNTDNRMEVSKSGEGDIPDDIEGGEEYGNDDEIPEDALEGDAEAGDLQQGSVESSTVQYSDDFVSKPNSLDQLLIGDEALEVDDEDEDDDDDEPQFVGVITFKLVSGSDIAPRSTLFEGKCDPYVVLSLGAQQVECQPANNSVNPTWNERMLLSWDGFSVLHAQVNDFNEEPVKHEFLGEAYVDLEALELEPDQSKILDVKLEGAPSGSLQFEITLRAG